MISFELEVFSWLANFLLSFCVNFPFCLAYGVQCLKLPCWQFFYHKKLICYSRQVLVEVLGGSSNGKKSREGLPSSSAEEGS